MKFLKTTALFQLCVVGVSVALMSANSVAQEAAADSDALKALKSLVDKPGMLLSTGPDSASEHFGIRCLFASRGDGKGKEGWGWELWALRDGKRVLAWVRSVEASGKGHARAVVADGVIACLDPKRSGGLVVSENAFPVVRIGSDGGGVNFAFESAGAPEFLFDPASVIRSALAKSPEVAWGKDGKRIVIRTKRAAFGVIPAAAGSSVPCTVEGMEFLGGGDQVLQVLVVAVLERQAAEKVAALKPLTVDGIKALGLPTRTPEKGELSRLLSPAPDDVASDPKRLAASEKLSGLPREADHHFPAVPSGGESKR